MTSVGGPNMCTRLLELTRNYDARRSRIEADLADARQQVLDTAAEFPNLVELDRSTTCPSGTGALTWCGSRAVTSSAATRDLSCSGVQRRLGTPTFRAQCAEHSTERGFLERRRRRAPKSWSVWERRRVDSSLPVNPKP